MPNKLHFVRGPDSRESGQPSRVGLDQAIGNEGAAKLVIGIELVDDILPKIDSTRTVATEPNDDQLRFVGQFKFRAFNERLGLGQNIFSMMLLMGHGQQPVFGRRQGNKAVGEARRKCQSTAAGILCRRPRAAQLNSRTSSLTGSAPT